MRARKLLEKSLATFDPATLATIYEAFDQAWGVVAGNYGTDPKTVEAARLKLADAMLAVVHQGMTDSHQLASLALQMMRINESISERDLDDVPTKPPRRR